jgi:hypothetical protein
MLTAIPFSAMLLTKRDDILTVTPWDRILEKLIKETLHLLWNSFHYRVRKTKFLVLILNRLNSVHTLTYYIFKTHFNIVTYPGFAWIIITGFGFDDRICWTFIQVRYNSSQITIWLDTGIFWPHCSSDWTDCIAPPKSKLLYDGRFTANQFVLASSPLRPTTGPFFFQLNSCGNIPYVTSSLTRRWVCLSQICLVFRRVYIPHI